MNMTKITLFFKLFFLLGNWHFDKEKTKIEENSFINIRELININISADGHPIMCTFV